jgi:hypothetical protein
MEVGPMNYAHEIAEHKEKRKPTPARMPTESRSSLDWDQMESYLKARELSYKTACHNGWYPSCNAGDGALRIVMPATNSAKIAYWQARAVYKDMPRYQSPSVPRGDSVIQVWPLSKDYLPFTILCEGPMDALAAASHGIRGIALMGNNPTAETLSMIAALVGPGELVSYFADRDALQEAIKIVGRLQALGIYTTVTDPSPHKDLASMPWNTRCKVLEAYHIAGSSRHSEVETERQKQRGTS